MAAGARLHPALIPTFCLASATWMRSPESSCSAASQDQVRSPLTVGSCRSRVPSLCLPRTRAGCGSQPRHRDARPVVVAGAEQLTAIELRSAACGIAQRVLDGGHDAVIYIGGNSLRFPVALFGAARAGVPFIPLNYRLSGTQLDALLAAHPDALRL